MKEEYAAGTTYDGATPLLSAVDADLAGRALALPVDLRPGRPDLRLGRVRRQPPLRPRRRRPARLPPRRRARGRAATTSMLGDSYSSGFGNGVLRRRHARRGRRTTASAPRTRSARSWRWRSISSRPTTPARARSRRTSTSRATRVWGEPSRSSTGSIPRTGLVTFSIGGNDAHFARRRGRVRAGRRAAAVQHVLQRGQGHRAGRRGVRPPRQPELVPGRDRRRTTRSTRTSAGARRTRPTSRWATRRSSRRRARDRTFLPGGRCELHQEGRPEVDGLEDRRVQRADQAQRRAQRLPVRRPDVAVPRPRAVRRGRRVVLRRARRRQVPPDRRRPAGDERGRRSRSCSTTTARASRSTRARRPSTSS